LIVQIANAADELRVHVLFAQAAQILRIGRIEGNPQADEAHVVIVARLARAPQPAQRPPHAQRERRAARRRQRLVRALQLFQCVRHVSGSCLV